MEILAGVVIIGVMIFFATRRGLQMKQLANHGVVIEALVLKLFTRGSGGSVASTAIQYEFHAANGHRYTNRINVTMDVYDDHEEGGPIAIVYLERKPQVNAAKYMVNTIREALKLPPL